MSSVGCGLRPALFAQPREAAINEDGILLLQGFFETTPTQVHYDLKYILSEGEWKPIKINVSVKAPDESKAPDKK